VVGARRCQPRRSSRRHGEHSLELGTAASALRYRGEPGAASGTLLVRHHVELGAFGVWTGVGGGRGRAAARARRPRRPWEAGAWLRGARLRGSLSVAVLRARLDTVDRGIPGATDAAALPCPDRDRRDRAGRVAHAARGS
jgi:hypothetical protein